MAGVGKAGKLKKRLLPEKENRNGIGAEKWEKTELVCSESCENKTK